MTFLSCSNHDKNISRRWLVWFHFIEQRLALISSTADIGFSQFGLDALVAAPDHE
jgi:hypothetical protein